MNEEHKEIFLLDGRSPQARMCAKVSVLCKLDLFHIWRKLDQDSCVGWRGDCLVWPYFDGLAWAPTTRGSELCVEEAETHDTP